MENLMMKEKVQCFDLTNHEGAIIAPELLLSAEMVHRQLRHQLPPDYWGKMKSVFAGGGRMAVAVMKLEVLGVAVFRVYENTFSGLHLYVDDLVTHERKRSNGVGEALLTHLQTKAKDLGCSTLTLDSGTHRQQAHKFYFREGLAIVSFHFAKVLK